MCILVSYRPQIRSGGDHLWSVVDEPHRLPVGQYVKVSVPNPGKGGQGSRLVYIKEHSEGFVDRATGRQMVVVHGPLRKKVGFLDTHTARPPDPRIAAVEHQRSTRGSCDECGRFARLVDGVCRPCLRDR